MKLSERCFAIAPSMTLAMDAKAKKMKADGEDVIGFGAGEPDFDTPDYIKDAAKEALDLGMTKYTPASGTVALRNAICEKLKKDNGLDYDMGQIVVSNGAKHSLFNAFAAILNPGDEVIIPAPYWVTYPELIKFNGGVPVFVETAKETGFIPNAKEIEKAVTAKTKAILINSPNNPTGAVYSAELLKEIAEIAKKNDLMIISDEIYEKLVYEGEKHVSIASIDEESKQRTILINGFSKAYSMTGWRIGYAATTTEIAKAMGSFQSQATSNPNSIAMHAAAAALKGSESSITAMVEAFDRRRKLLVSKIDAIDGLCCVAPRGAFYVMMDISAQFGKAYNGKAINNSMDFCNILLEEKKVAIVPGIAFGADYSCRLSYAISDEGIQKGFDRIAEYVAQIK